jgi:peptidoglycan hydrolase-like protein with peptidoglycan-binding domain
LSIAPLVSLLPRRALRDILAPEQGRCCLDGTMMVARLLKRTQRRPDVGRWQYFLIGQGLLDGEADGVFGVQTDAATRAFQERECLEADGIVGPDKLGCAKARGLVSFQRMRDAEVTPALTTEAKRLLALHHAAPYGSEYPFTLDGSSHLARLEQHYHEPGGPLKPWGYLSPGHLALRRGRPRLRRAGARRPLRVGPPGWPGCPNASP